MRFGVNRPPSAQAPSAPPPPPQQQQQPPPQQQQQQQQQAPRNQYADERTREAVTEALDRNAVLAMHCLVHDLTPTRMRAQLMQQLAGPAPAAPGGGA